MEVQDEGRQPGAASKILRTNNVSAVGGATAVDLAGELQKRVNMFMAGDEKYSGAWLVDFQRLEGAWPVCVQALQMGPQTECSPQLLQEFASQTLASRSRAFLNCHAEHNRRAARDELEQLLVLHGEGEKLIWKQLSLALTCADFWLGIWTATAVISGGGLPMAVRNELIALPPDLLSSNRALPLDTAALRHSAGSALISACPVVFPYLLPDDIEKDEEGPLLRALATWLRTMRKSLEYLDGSCDGTEPIRCLMARGSQLISAMRIAPKEGCEVAEQLALWRGCDNELAQLLQPVLSCLFECEDEVGMRQSLLPLLANLATLYWPRAALGDFNIDWQSVATQAINVLHTALVEGDTEDGGDAEAALAVWQTFAVTLREGASGWHAPRERIASAEALPSIFQVLSRELLAQLRAPPDPTAEAMSALFELRDEAQSTLSSWATLVGEAPLWTQAMWGPLHQVGSQLTSSCNSSLFEEFWRDAEVVFWFCGTLAKSWPEHAGDVPVACAVLELSRIDTAPQHWRPLLWAAACNLASTAPPDKCPQLIEWMLQRPPTLEALELLELPYAQAVEAACRRLPNGISYPMVAERFLALALTAVPKNKLHEHSAEARGLFLRSMHHVMSGDEGALCQGLSQNAFPTLRQDVEIEAGAASMLPDPPWHAAQALFATLVASVPGEPVALGVQHPSLALWEQHWNFLEDALLRWPQSSANDQPAAAATKALTIAARTLPELFPKVIGLIAESAAQNPLPDVQLRALREIAVDIASPPLDPAQAADALSEAIIKVADAMLTDVQEVRQSPTTVSAYFQLISAGIRIEARSGGAAACASKLRSSLLAWPALVSQSIALVGAVLPESPSEDAMKATLLFLALLFQGEELQDPTHRVVLQVALPDICAALCTALATQAYLADVDGCLVDVVQVLICATDAFPGELPVMMSDSLGQLEAADWAKERLRRHLVTREEWPRRGEWVEHFQHVLRELQNSRKAIDLLA